MHYIKILFVSHHAAMMSRACLSKNNSPDFATQQVHTVAQFANACLQYKQGQTQTSRMSDENWILPLGELELRPLQSQTVLSPQQCRVQLQRCLAAAQPVGRQPPHCLPPSHSLCPQ